MSGVGDPLPGGDPFPVFHQWGVDAGSSHTRITRDSDCMNIRRLSDPDWSTDPVSRGNPMPPTAITDPFGASGKFPGITGIGWVRISSVGIPRRFYGTEPVRPGGLVCLATALPIIVGLFFGLISGYYGNDRPSPVDRYWLAA